MPFECKAATFNFNNDRCLLYNSRNNLNGNMHLILDLNSNHYEKECILSNFNYFIFLFKKKKKFLYYYFYSGFG